MFRDGLPFNKHMFYYDAVGRLVVLDINLYGCSYRFSNVYAPNNHADQVVYWGWGIKFSY